MDKIRTRLIGVWKKKSPLEKISAFLIGLGVLLVFYYLLVNWAPKWYRQLTYREDLDMTVTGQSYVPLPIYMSDDCYYRFTYPTDQLFTTEERGEYESGDMLLQVPRLSLTAKVQNGTTASDLKHGPGLYQGSALPSFGNPNVSIAAHRGVYGAEFYYLDKLTDGDLLYLEYDGFLFTYEYVSTAVVQADDWSEMYCTDYSAITLTTCQLTGSDERICVRGKLISITPLPGTELSAQSETAQSESAPLSGG